MDYWYYTLKDKSKILNIEIEGYSSYEDPYDIIDYFYYKNGETLKLDKIHLKFNDDDDVSETPLYYAGDKIKFTEIADNKPLKKEKDEIKPANKKKER